MTGPFAAVCGVGFLGRLSYEMARSPLTPLFARHLGAPVQLIGLIVAAVTISGIVVKLPAGALSDVFGFRPLMFAGAIVKATGPLLYLLAFTWPGLLFIRFYHGLATALYAPPASALVAKAYPDARGRKLGVYNAAESAGTVLGPVLGGAVLTWTLMDFNAAFLVCGAIGVLALLIMFRVPSDALTRAPERRCGDRQLRAALEQVAVGVRQIASEPSIRLVSLVEAVLWLGIGSVQAYLPLYAASVHIPVVQIGLIAGAQGIASVLTRPLMGRYSDRLGSRKPLIVAGIVVCVACLVTLPHVVGFWPLIGFSSLFGLGTGLVTPSTMAMIGDLVTRNNYGSAMGVFGSLWDVGHASGPVLFGLLLLVSGYQVAWLVMALLMSCALVVFLGAGRLLR
nr:MFS transporter [Allobranchiibius sp. GilTou38]